MTRSRVPALARVVAGVALAHTLGAGPLPAQGSRTVVNFPLHLIDLSLVSDTVHGVQILMQPSVQSKQSRDGGLIWLRFDPDTVLDWLNSAAAALAVPVPNGAVEGIQWSRTLTPLTVHGGLALGRERKKGKLEKTRWLAIGDSATGWKTEVTSAEADSLLRVLMTLGTQSRLDTTASVPLDERRVGVPVKIVFQPAPRFRGKTGRVVTTYVVDENGRADPGTFVALLASDPALIPDAWDMLRASRFEPARLEGKPVRQLVRQAIIWYPNP